MKKIKFLLVFFGISLFVSNALADDNVKINIAFQQPSHILEKDNSSIFLEEIIILNCDSSKEECKVNFDYRNSFSGVYKEKDFECISSFSFGETGEENKCNPNVINIPKGEHDIFIKISKKDDPYHFDEMAFKIINTGFIKESLSKKENIVFGDVDIISKLIIDVQGNIGENKILNENTLTCIDTCSVNLDSSNSLGKLENHYWDFGNGEFFSGKNPNYIKYEKFGDYCITLTATDNNGTKLEEKFYISFIEKEKPKKEELLESNLLTYNGNIKSAVINNNDINQKYFELVGSKKDFGKYVIFLIITASLGTIFLFLKNTKLGKQYGLHEDCDI